MIFFRGLLPAVHERRVPAAAAVSPRVRLRRAPRPPLVPVAAQEPPHDAPAAARPRRRREPDAAAVHARPGAAGTRPTNGVAEGENTLLIKFDFCDHKM